ncbi:MAG: hypothetical protein R2788_21330 [Saprospiraceae bacterium]
MARKKGLPRPTLHPQNPRPRCGHLQEARSFMGVRNIHTLAQIPPKLLQRNSASQHHPLEKANAIDDTWPYPITTNKKVFLPSALSKRIRPTPNG